MRAGGRGSDCLPSGDAAVATDLRSQGQANHLCSDLPLHRLRPTSQPRHPVNIRRLFGNSSPPCLCRCWPLAHENRLPRSSSGPVFRGSYTPSITHASRGTYGGYRRTIDHGHCMSLTTAWPPDHAQKSFRTSAKIDRFLVNIPKNESSGPVYMSAPTITFTWSESA